MRLSSYFVKTSKQAPADEPSKNAQLLIRAGYIHKEMAGVYAYLPLGLRVIEKLKAIVRQEMDALGGQELVMTALQRPELWAKTKRWSDEVVDIWFKSKLKNDQEIGLSWSHEEPITDMMTNFISSYRDLPVYVYQFQTKLRNELRAKSGILRGREFLMKDMYSYSLNDAEHQQFYDKTAEAYLRVFERVGLGDNTYKTFASGGAFTQFSHEFQTITDAGEDIIYLQRDRKLAINKEVLTPEIMRQLGVKREELEEVKAAEVGNIFSFGTAKSEQLELFYVDEHGQRLPVVLGSYGIGITRLMGVIVETKADAKGLIWPNNIAPAKAIILRAGEDNETVKLADDLYHQLTDNQIEVLYDDRDLRLGEKFAEADLLGIPYQIIVSPKSLDLNGSLEVKTRLSGNSETLNRENVIKLLAG